jgi:hypothetical protein
MGPHAQRMEITTPSMVTKGMITASLFANPIEKTYDLGISDYKLISKWILLELVDPSPLPPW